MKLSGVILLLCSWACVAQEYPVNEIDLSRLADEFFGYQETDESPEEMYDNIIQLLNNPLDLNRASAEDFRFLSFLSEPQVQSIIDHRNFAGDFLSVYELQSISTLDDATIHRLAPFVKVYEPSSSIRNILHRIAHDNNNYLVMRVERTIESKKGFTSEAKDNERFKGSPDRLYLRVRSSKANDYSLGITTEKDAGERFTWKPHTGQYGMDYWSAHLQLQNKKKIKNLIVGDFQSQFGQGLILGGAFGAGKGAETVLAVRKSTIGFVPYSSVNEVTFSRGLATTIRVARNIHVSGMFSMVRRDANTATDTTGSAISSLGSTGLHRNGKEQEDRSKIVERQAGVIVNYRKERFDAGVIYHLLAFSDQIHKQKNQYNQFAFDGTVNQNVSVFLNHSLNNFTFFSEAAKTLGGGSALIIGGIGSLGDRLDLSILFRRYARDFFTVNSNAFSESSTPQNESGIYWGWKYRIKRKYSLSGYMDMFWFPWLRFRSYSPSTGHEWFLRLSYQPSKDIQAFVQMREESKVRNLPDNPMLYPVAEGTKRNVILNFHYGVGQPFQLKTRVQFSTYRLAEKTSKGFTILQDISVKPLSKLELTMRYSLFDTEDFDNRQYVYESDVWMAYSMPAYYGKGIRRYILVEYKVNKKLSFWFRFAATGYSSQENIGSGLDTIHGNKRNDVKFQARIKF